MSRWGGCGGSGRNTRFRRFSQRVAGLAEVELEDRVAKGADCRPTRPPAYPAPAKEQVARFMAIATSIPWVVARSYGIAVAVHDEATRSPNTGGRGN